MGGQYYPLLFESEGALGNRLGEIPTVSTIAA